MERYGRIETKRKREIVLLRGKGCVYRKCAFCDYYDDSDSDELANYKINAETLDRVTGIYGDLEVINSGSVFELDSRTLDMIKRVCGERGVDTIHFESHYLYRNRIEELRKQFSSFDLKMKLGLETFDFDLREKVMKKGIPDRDPAVIARYFDEANFLFGLKGQMVDSMMRDISLGLEHFERICVNVMCENTAPLKPDKDVIAAFMREVYPIYKDDFRVDILVNNTDFGVGD